MTSPTVSVAAVDPLVLTRRASAGQRLGATAIDVLIPLLWIGIAVALFATTHPAFGWLSLVVGLGTAAATLRSLAMTGLSVGRLATGTRTVRRSTGAPAGAALAGALFRRDLASFDIRRGRDPISPALGAFEFPDATPAAFVTARKTSGMPPTAALDSGEFLSVGAALIIGRNPTAPLDAPAEVYQWPDLSRTLSKSHARLEWDGRRLWAVDLGSTNGTILRSDTAVQRLVPFQRTPVELDGVLELGDRIVRIRTSS